MRSLIAAALMAIGLYGLTVAGPAPAMAHHSTAHSVGPCGLTPCPPKGPRK